MAVDEGGSSDCGESTGYLVAKKMAELRSLPGDVILHIIAGAKGYKITKEMALFLRTKNLIEQNPPRKSKESE